jgi:phosphoglycerate dehydrogenase-like enzyme
VEYKGTPLEVASSADVVSVHLALTKETRGCINAEFFNSMRPWPASIWKQPLRVMC